LSYVSLIGETVSSVSNKYNTTFQKVEGVYTDVNERVQVTLYDTPGAIKLSNTLGSKKLVTKAWNIILDCDKVK